MALLSLSQVKLGRFAVYVRSPLLLFFHFSRWPREFQKRALLTAFFDDCGDSYTVALFAMTNFLLCRCACIEYLEANLCVFVLDSATMMVIFLLASHTSRKWLRSEFAVRSYIHVAMRTAVRPLPFWEDILWMPFNECSFPQLLT